jgi:putative flippase GtrA
VPRRRAAWPAQIRALALLAVVPSIVDIGLLVTLRQGLGWPLLVANPTAIALASAVSYAVHRRAARRTAPYTRWVQAPLSFLVVAVVAGAIDTAVLRLLFSAAGFTTAAGLVAAKVVSLAVAAGVRFVGYRTVLSELVRRNRSPSARPLDDGTHRFSVVIPAFREPDRITPTIDAIRAELDDVAADGGLEIIVVDDGSGDATTDAACAAGADQVITLPANRGKGAAVRAGMLASRGRVVAFTDADLAYHPRHLRFLLLAVEAGWDVAIGNRRHPGSVVARASTLRAVGSRMVNRMSAAVLLAAPLDTQCGLKAFRGDVARSIFRQARIDGFAFDIEVLHLVERRGLSLHDIPVHLDETGGSSTVDITRDIVRLSADMARIRWWASRGEYDRPSEARSEARQSDQST